MKLGDIVKTYRKDNDLTMREFAQRCNVSHSYIAMLEDGKNSKTGAPITPTLVTLKKIAEGMNISVDELISAAEDMPVKLEKTQQGINLQLFGAGSVARKKLRMLGNVACGEPIFADEDRETLIDVNDDLDADFCLTAKGDSMINARIFDGDILFVKIQPTVNNGEIAVVLIEDEATVKRVYYDRENSILTLVPENPKYKPLRYSGSELDRIRILGKVVSGNYTVE